MKPSPNYSRRGAWDIPDGSRRRLQTGLSRGLSAEGWKNSHCRRPLCAPNAVEASIVRAPKNAPVFERRLSALISTPKAKFECDAIVMDGASFSVPAQLRACGRIKKPPSAPARAIYEHCPHMMLIAEGRRGKNLQKKKMSNSVRARRTRQRSRMEAYLRCSKDEHAAEHPSRPHAQGTVGRRSSRQRRPPLPLQPPLAATCCKLPGRVGDSPLHRLRLLRPTSPLAASSCTGSRRSQS